MSRCARLLISLSICLGFLPLAAAQEKGLIRGMVVDEEGVPVSGAKVHAEPTVRRAGSLFMRFVETDAAGRYVIDRLDWGTYRVFAMKEESGYPNMYWSLYSKDALPTATVGPSTPVADFKIQMGPKAGILSGSVTNALTGSPVNAGFKLIGVASPNQWISTSVPPDYGVLLPADTDILLEVSAPGYQTWYYGGASDISKRSPLRLASGSRMHLDVLLEPAHDPKLHPSKFLIPDGYIGWLQLEYGVKEGPPVPIEDGIKVFKFPTSGILMTESAGPDRGADDKYFYYSKDGSVQEISMRYRAGNGMVWGNYAGSKGGVMSLFGFFVGTKEQYKKYQSRSTRPGPVPTR